MNKQLNIILMALLLYVKAFSQSTHTFNLEAGALINKPLISGERLKSNGESTTVTDWTYRYYASTGFFFKFSYEWKLVSQNKWTLFLPTGMSYLSQRTKYHRQGYSMGCFTGESANELKSVSNSNTNLFFGAALRYDHNKFRYSGSLLLNNCFTIDTKVRSTPDNKSDAYTNAHRQLQYNLYLSSQFCVLYHLKKNVWIGPACELFYVNGLHLVRTVSDRVKSSQSFDRDYSPSTNITGKNCWINPGIKLQIDLK